MKNISQTVRKVLNHPLLAPAIDPLYTIAVPLYIMSFAAYKKVKNVGVKKTLREGVWPSGKNDGFIKLLNFFVGFKMAKMGAAFASGLALQMAAPSLVTQLAGVGGLCAGAFTGALIPQAVLFGAAMLLPALTNILCSPVKALQGCSKALSFCLGRFTPKFLSHLSYIPILPNDLLGSALCTSLNTPRPDEHMAIMLVKGGASLLHQTEKENDTALHLCVRNNACDTARALLQHNASFLTRNNGFRTPLEQAYHDHENGTSRHEIIYVLENLAHTPTPDSRGYALMDAIKNAGAENILRTDTMDTCRKLIASETNLKIQDENGRTPRDYAIFFGFTGLAEELAAQGIDMPDDVIKTLDRSRNDDMIKAIKKGQATFKDKTSAVFRAASEKGTQKRRKIIRKNTAPTHKTKAPSS
ncbi:MAG: ankyrin repeat domain-containing protein [Alphaproteobacteria bacterium]|nr:ankyrin repeat domain-containing protein [Alphaproteobacteria bacterium]